MQTMKTKECLKRTARLLEIGVRKATSYKVVKSRLGNRLYSDEFLQDRIKLEDSQRSRIDA